MGRDSVDRIMRLTPEIKDYLCTAFGSYLLKGLSEDQAWNRLAMLLNVKAKSLYGNAAKQYTGPEMEQIVKGVHNGN